jgi:hypothetical protein
MTSGGVQVAGNATLGLVWRTNMPILLWLLGVPIPIIILLLLLWH